MTDKLPEVKPTTADDRAKDLERDRRVEYVEKAEGLLKSTIYQRKRAFLFYASNNIVHDMMERAGADNYDEGFIKHWHDLALDDVIEIIKWKELGECSRGECNAYYDKDGDDTGFCSEECAGIEDYDEETAMGKHRGIE